MVTAFVLIPCGILICLLGIVNMKGNISSLHSYHRNHVAPEDIKPFGRLVGLGTLIVGLSVLVFSGFLIASLLLDFEMLAAIGSGVMIAVMTVGIVITFYAIKKYNGKIFG